MEFVLEGLHLSKRLNKDAVGRAGNLSGTGLTACPGATVTAAGTAPRSGFELGADDVLSEITDDLLYHGDLNAALRRMLQSGFRDRNQERVAGVRELLERSGGGAVTSWSATTWAASTTTSPRSCAT